MNTPNTPTLPERLPRPYRVERDGDRPIAFRGSLLGAATHEVTSRHDGIRRTTLVRIYATASGQIVTAVKQTRSGYANSANRAGVHGSPDEALQWLRDDSKRGDLGPASLEAWSRACSGNSPLSGLAVEQI